LLIGGNPVKINTKKHNDTMLKARGIRDYKPDQELLQVPFDMNRNWSFSRTLRDSAVEKDCIIG